MVWPYRKLRTVIRSTSRRVRHSLSPWPITARSSGPVANYSSRYRRTHVSTRTFVLSQSQTINFVLTPAAAAFVQRVEWADDIAVSWRPHDDPHSPVRMAPDVRFGRPAY
jgi:hypothetical protein